MTFAPELPRKINQSGKEVIIFPDDANLRAGLFKTKGKEVRRNNLHIYLHLAKYLMEPGERILDPMGGAGSVMILSTQGFKTFLIEINSAFYDIVVVNAGALSNSLTGGSVSCIPGDCRFVLPMPGMDHIIFSPPYANQLHDDTSGTMDTYEQKMGDNIRTFIDKSPGNLGNMRDFFFDKAMTDVYTKCFASLRPGGTMTFIIKDHIKAKKRVRVTEHHVRLSARAGFMLHEWHQRESIGGIFGRINKSKGQEIVEEEDIVIMRKPL
jgi:hypothetical protein